MRQDQLLQIISDFQSIRPELILMGASLLVLILDLFRVNRIVLLSAFVLALLAAIAFLDIPTESKLLFSDTLVLGPMEGLISLFLSASLIWVVFFPEARRRPMEFYFLLLALLVGSLFMLKANHLLLVYLALELTSFSGYLLTNFNFQKRSFEAGLKYLLFGGVSSAIMLYGMSLVYGYTGSMVLSSWTVVGSDPFLLLGVGAFLVGLLFKASLFPFHIWTPGTYEEAPTAAVAIVSIVPKVAGFVLLHRVLVSLSLPWVSEVMVVVAILTILVGTFGAIGQQNVKRLIAYGAIAHSGFLLACLVPTGALGATSFMWYVLIYTLMNLLIFYMIAVYEELGAKTVTDFAGLGSRHVLFGVLFVLALVSLIGLPPTAGFTAKLYLFSALWSTYQLSSSWLVLLLLIVAVMSVGVSLFYYLKIPFHLYISSAEPSTIRKPESSGAALATILAAILLWLFFDPEMLNKISEHIKFIAW